MSTDRFRRAERIAAILADPEVQRIGALIQDEETRAGQELHAELQVLQDRYETAVRTGDLTVLTQVCGGEARPVGAHLRTGHRPRDPHSALGHHSRRHTGRLDRQRTRRRLTPRTRPTGGAGCRWQEPPPAPGVLAVLWGPGPHPYTHTARADLHPTHPGTDFPVRLTRRPHPWHAQPVLPAPHGGGPCRGPKWACHPQSPRACGGGPIRTTPWAPQMRRSGSSPLPAGCGGDASLRGGPPYGGPPFLMPGYPHPGSRGCGRRRERWRGVRT